MVQKIVHLIFALEVGGAENLLVDIANEQVQLADVSIIIINDSYHADLINRISPQVHCYTLNRKAGNKRSVLFLMKLWMLLIRIRPTVLHCHNHTIICFLRGFHKRSVLTVHSLSVAGHHFKKYKRIYSISEAVAHDIRQRTGINSQVILNGINFIQVIPKRNYTIGTQMKLRMVQVGRLVHEIKGQDLLLYALRKVLSDDHYRNITIDFIGEGSSRPYLEEMVDRLSLRGHVFFLGERSRSWIYQHLSTYDLLVQPSRSEGFGLTIVEGIAAGLPVIASDHAGPREILQHLPGSCLFPPGDIDALASCIKKMACYIREDQVQSLCEVSRKLAGRYSIRHTALEYLKHYSADLKSNQPATR